MAKLAWVLVGVLVCAAAVDAAEIGNLPPGPETVATLRARGPEGLAEAVRIHDGLVADRGRLNLMCRAVPEEETAELDRNIEAWRQAIDQIRGQRSCTVSRLYWQWMYAEFFLTSIEYPWLGLAPSDVYTALNGDGRVQPAQATAPHGG